MVKKQRNNLSIFRPFLDLQEFFKNRGVTFETSDCRDRLEELFHMVNKNFFEKKIKIAKVISKSHIKGPLWKNLKIIDNYKKISA